MKRKHQVFIRQTLHKQGIEETITRKKHASVIHENEQQSQKEARANAEETRKRCLETETSRRTAETNNEEDTKKKKGQDRVEVRQ